MSSLTMAQVLWPQRTAGRFSGAARDAALVVVFSLVTALASQVAIHLPLVPINGLTFAVLLTGALLGPRLGALTMVLYLAEGCAGLPVFAEGHSAWTPGTLPGLPTIVGATAGYLYACPFAAALVGWLARRGWDRKPGTMLLAMVLGSLVFYVFGAPWLAHLPHIGLRSAWLLGVLPFLPGDIIKAVLAAGLLPAGWKLLNNRGR